VLVLLLPPCPSVSVEFHGLPRYSRGRMRSGLEVWLSPFSMGPAPGQSGAEGNGKTGGCMCMPMWFMLLGRGSMFCGGGRWLGMLRLSRWFMWFMGKWLR
jgi:hypothetical protein